MSLALAALFGAGWIWLQILDSAHVLTISLTPAIILVSLLAQINAQLALFNLAPGYPLDGGRVFRAILWGVTDDIRRATWWAARAGQVIAVLLIAAGGALFFFQFNGGGIWLALIGLFLWNAAGEGYRQTVMAETLRDATVGQLMTREIESVPPNMALSEFVDHYLIPKREQTFAVFDGTAFQGAISVENVKRVPRAEWTARRVRDVMTPLTSLEQLSPDQTAAAAMAKLSGADVSDLPVFEGGQLTGFIGRAELSRFLRLKSELGR